MHLLFVFGTRPEAIKMAPIIKHLAKNKDITTTVCVTGQHDTMLKQVLSIFNIEPDYNLSIMQHNQSLNGIVSKVVDGLTDIYHAQSPDYVLVQGDTTSAFAAALAAFNLHIPVAHVEAGLRSGNRLSPWPEEMNRRLITPLAELHFTPTQVTYDNLIQDGVSPHRIDVCGNTVIDALLDVSLSLNKNKRLHKQQDKEYQYLDHEKRLIVVTGHRRENFGDGFENICHALKTLSQREDVQIIYPVHLNPNVREPVNRILGGCENIHLVAPTDYLSFVYLLNEAYFILTDSGGIQEEAPSLGKPVLVMRDNTERPEAVTAGTSLLVGTSEKRIIQAAYDLLDNVKHYKAMSHKKNPYGDGQAAKQIIKRLLKDFEAQQAANVEWFHAHHHQQKSSG